MLHACKGNTPANVKQEYTSKCMCVCEAMKRGYECVYATVIMYKISCRQLLVCVSECNEGVPRSAQERCAPRCIGVCASDIKRGHECVYVSVIFILQKKAICVYICTCMYMYINSAKQL